MIEAWTCPIKKTCYPLKDAVLDEEQPEKIQDRRGQTNKVVEHMLEERNQLLGMLLQASNIQSTDPSDTDFETLNEFCQVLVDYIAAGHFGLYERIVKKQERRKNVADLALQIYPDIDNTTQVALAFNEKYDPEYQPADYSALQKDLSTLGETLTNRIELEDKLINELRRRLQN